MKRSLFVHLAPGCDDRVIVNRRRPSWCRIIRDYIDYGHSQVVSREAFALLTGLSSLPPFPKIAVLDQDNSVVGVLHPEKRGRR